MADALTDEDWAATLRGVHAALRPGGHLVFEVRDPARQAWLRWTRETTYRSLDAPGIGRVETWWVRDAPDRPGREWVFIARKPG